MSPPVLEALGVNKILGSGPSQVHALKDVTLTLRGGELTMLMGPSGSGKTTLLSVLGLMLAPTAGTVRVAGVATQGASPETLAELRRKHVGFIFQNFHLFPTLTASENVQIALDVRGIHGDAARERANAALARVDLPHKLGSFPRELSGGEQQRVAIARAIVSDPSYVLADEPTAALDGKNGQAIMSILADIAKDPGRGVLVVTHDTRLTGFADRTVDIEDGRLVREQRNGAAEAVPVALGGA
jgi:putative ABC transport system ATP-binding protein